MSAKLKYGPGRSRSSIGRSLDFQSSKDPRFGLQPNPDIIDSLSLMPYHEPMRFLLIALASFLAAGSVRAQTNAPRYQPKSSDFRIVNGKMYNRALSTNWTTLPPSGSTYAVLASVPEGLVLQSRKADMPGDTILLKHYAADKTPAKGDIITISFRAMPVDAFKYEDMKISAFDCGLPNTPQNRKTLVNGPIH